MQTVPLLLLLLSLFLSLLLLSKSYSTSDRNIQKNTDLTCVCFFFSFFCCCLCFFDGICFQIKVKEYNKKVALINTRLNFLRHFHSSSTAVLFIC